MSLKVLIIEDKAIVGLNIKRVIKSMGHKVLMVVNTASDALKIAQKNKIDLLISATNIKGEVDGMECSSILKKNYNIPVIFLTEYKDKKRVEKASKIDFVGCLEKPFCEDELKTMINLVI